MHQVKRRIFAGNVCEQEVYTVSDRSKPSRRKGVPAPRFKSEAEYTDYKERQNRQRFTRLINANFTPASWYVTLTFDTAHEIYTFDDARRERDNYFRRIKYAYPDAVILAVMGRGKNTARIHFHMLIDGVPEESILKCWRAGSVVDCRHLKAHNICNGIDYGQDYTALANYLYNHWTPEQGGHRFKITKNAKRPIAERPKDVLVNYSPERPPIAPRGYIYVEGYTTQYGYAHYKYIKLPPKKRRDVTPEDWQQKQEVLE